MIKVEVDLMCCKFERRFFALVMFGFGILPVWSLQSVRPACAAPPHIVFVLADDLGTGDVGCYGGALTPTPELDRMAKEGIRFSQYYSASPICSPSRCGLLTDMSPGRWQITSFLQERKGNRECEQRDFLDPTAPSLPRQLKAAGYRTKHVGKWHLGGGRDVVDPPKFAAYGYDESAGTYESPEPHPDITATDWIWSDQDPVKRWDRTRFFVDQTLDFIKRHPDQPCFVNVWLDDPHTPWVPDAKGRELPKGATRERLKGVMEELDRQMGRLVRELPENTLLIFASDNGPLPTFKGDRSAGMRGSKLSLYEAGIRLPLIARWPGHIAPNQVDTEHVIAAVDMLPTLCRIAGAALPDGYRGDGIDCSDRLLARSNPQEATRPPLYWEYGRNDKSFKYPEGRDRSPNVAVRDGAWKLLFQYDSKLTEPPTLGELYDLNNDPQEKTNVAKDHPEIMQRLIKAAWDCELAVAQFTSSWGEGYDWTNPHLSLYLPGPCALCLEVPSLSWANLLRLRSRDARYVYGGSRRGRASWPRARIRDLPPHSSFRVRASRHTPA